MQNKLDIQNKKQILNVFLKSTIFCSTIIFVYYTYKYLNTSDFNRFLYCLSAWCLTSLILGEIFNYKINKMVEEYYQETIEHNTNEIELLKRANEDLINSLRTTTRNGNLVYGRVNRLEDTDGDVQVSPTEATNAYDSRINYDEIIRRIIKDLDKRYITFDYANKTYKKNSKLNKKLLIEED